MAKKCDNRFIPKYIPNDLSWYEKDGLDTWYLQNKCNDFLRATDNHFKEMERIFELIKSNVSEEQIKQYQQINHHEIMGYPHKLREEICSLIFHNVKRDGMYVKKRLLMNILRTKKLVQVVDDLSKKLKTVSMLSLGDLYVCFCHV